MTIRWKAVAQYFTVVLHIRWPTFPGVLTWRILASPWSKTLPANEFITPPHTFTLNKRLEMLLDGFVSFFSKSTQFSNSDMKEFVFYHFNLSKWLPIKFVSCHKSSKTSKSEIRLLQNQSILCQRLLRIAK